MIWLDATGLQRSVGTIVCLKVGRMPLRSADLGGQLIPAIKEENRGKNAPERSIQRSSNGRCRSLSRDAQRRRGRW